MRRNSRMLWFVADPEDAVVATTRTRKMTKDDETLWHAVENRDAACDGEFVYGVVTTGIYCRPSCPSRRPLRANTRYFDDPRAAEAHGFRACKRCRPAAQSSELERIQDALRYIEAHADEPVRLALLAERAGLSAFHFQRRFKAVAGVTPKEYAEAARLKGLKRSLRESESVTDAIYDAGYGSGSRVYERVDTRLGMTPKQYRSGGEGVPISYAAGTGALGTMLIGATDRGVCFLQFGDDAEALLAALRAEYPAATLVSMAAAQRPAFDAWMQALAAYLDGATPNLDLPLDLSGTAFQLRVWKALLDIPSGAVVSYAELARQVGLPKAVRAVASACAANHVAVAVPCHRVIRGDGSLGGYRWGLARKRTLLDRERATATKTRP